MASLRPCLRCGKLVRGGSYCQAHRPAHSSPSSRFGLRRAPRLRRRARERDGNACARCGATGHLRVHHLVGVAEGGANALANLVTLCEDCHRREHRC